MMTAALCGSSTHFGHLCVWLQVDVLKHTDNRGSFYDNNSMLAAALEALGHLRLPDFKSLQPVLKQLDRFLAREKVLPSYHAVVAQAGLRAFVELALSMRPAGGFISRCRAVLCYAVLSELGCAQLGWAMLCCAVPGELCCAVPGGVGCAGLCCAILGLAGLGLCCASGAMLSLFGLCCGCQHYQHIV